MPYDRNNIFAKILRQEVPADIVWEDDYVLAFHDVSPQAPTHILVIPKGEYTSFFEFSASATADEMQSMNQAIYSIIKDFGLNKSGFRILSNGGSDGGQEVPHYHVHIFGGRPLGAMLAK